MTRGAKTDLEDGSDMITLTDNNTSTISTTTTTTKTDNKRNNKKSNKNFNSNITNDELDLLETLAMTAASNLDTLARKNTVTKETNTLRKDLDKSSKETFEEIEQEALNNIKKKIVSIDESKNILPTHSNHSYVKNNNNNNNTNNTNNNKKKNTVRFAAGGVTKEMKREAKLINLQKFADPSQGHYSSSDKQSLPKLFEIGTFVDNHTDYFNRFTKKEKKRGTIGDIMNNDKILNYIDRKSSEIERERYHKNYLRNQQEQKKGRPAKRVKGSELD